MNRRHEKEQHKLRVAELKERMLAKGPPRKFTQQKLHIPPQTVEDSAFQKDKEEPQKEDKKE